MNLKGIFPPLTTPFNAKGQLYPEKLKSNIEELSKYNLLGLLVLGSNGEFPLLSFDEKVSIINTARISIAKDRILLAGTGCQSTNETIDLTVASAEAGANAALILNPFFYKGLMNNSALAEFYLNVADESPIPVLIYNMPANSGIDMDADLIVELSQHQNIIGLKDSGGNMIKMEEIIGRVNADFTVLSGSAGFLLPALKIGAKGGILALANIAPQLCIDIYNYFNDSQLDKAEFLQKEIIKINKFVTREHGVPALKFTMDQLGLYGGPPRRPLLPLSDDYKSPLLELMNEIGLGRL